MLIDDELLKLMDEIEVIIDKLVTETNDDEIYRMNAELISLAKKSEALLKLLKNMPALESMQYTYEERKIGYEDWTSKFKTDLSFLSTCMVVDVPDTPYETALLHPEYSDKILTLEYYKTLDDAKLGHEKWKQVFDTCPPDFIIDMRDGLWGCTNIINDGKREVFRRKKC